MAGDNRGDLKLLLVALLLGAVIVFFLTAAAPAVAALNQGMGLKDAVPWGFGLTVGLFVH